MVIDLSGGPWFSGRKNRISQWDVVNLKCNYSEISGQNITGAQSMQTENNSLLFMNYTIPTSGDK